MNNYLLKYVTQFIAERYLLLTDDDKKCYEERIKKLYERASASTVCSYDDYAMISALYRLDIGIRLARKALAKEAEDFYANDNPKRAAFKVCAEQDAIYITGAILDYLVTNYARLKDNTFFVQEATFEWLEKYDSMFSSANEWYWEIDGSLKALFERVRDSLPDLLNAVYDYKSVLDADISCNAVHLVDSKVIKGITYQKF